MDDIHKAIRALDTTDWMFLNSTGPLDGHIM